MANHKAPVHHPEIQAAIAESRGARPGKKPDTVIGARQMSALQSRFVMEYLIDLNAAAAWVRAGGEPKHAKVMGMRLTKPNTLTGMAIARATAERAKRVGFTADSVLAKLGTIINTDRRALFREDGTVKTPGEFDEHDQVLIESVKTRRIVEVGPEGKLQQAEVQEVKLASLTPAITLAMRHLGMLNDKMEVTHMTPLAQRLEQAYQRTGRSKLTGEDAVIDGEYEDVTDFEEAENPSNDVDDAEMREILGE